jgi:anti-sigma factor RsiW
MSSCEEIIQLLTEYIEGDLSAVERQSFEAHMGDCGPCHRFLQTYQKTGAMAKVSLNCVEIPPQMQTRVRQFLKTRLGLDGKEC